METNNNSTNDMAASVAPAPAPLTIDDFAKIEMKIGKILSAEKIEESPKLLKLSVDFGEEKPRQVLSGIAKFITPDELVGMLCPFVTNLPPRLMLGQESQAMIVAAGDGESFSLLNPSKDIAPGTSLR